MNNKVKYSLVTVFVLVVLLLGLPAVSATRWKSSTLDAVNDATAVINKTNQTINDFEANPDVTSTDYDALIAAYKEERGAIEKAADRAKSVGGFKGLDVTGDYKKATDTSKKLVAIYDELLTVNSAEAASAEAEKYVIVAFEQSGDESDAAALQEQAQSIRSANDAYQKYLKTGRANDVERAFSEALARLATAFEGAAQAIGSGDVAEINAADSQLQSVIEELDALDVEIAAQNATDQQEVQTIIAKLNATAKELE